MIPQINHIVCGDCLELLPLIPDKTIDMVLCDLPYEMTAASWDQQLNIRKLWQQYNRILKPVGTVALFSSQPFTTRLISQNEAMFRYCWYWLKNQGTNFFHARSMPIRRVEEICIFGQGKYNPQITEGHAATNSAKGFSDGRAYYGTNIRDDPGGKTTRYPTNVLEFRCVDNYSRLHSAEKPVTLCEYLIKTYTDRGDLVLDHCIGSGTTAVACLNIGRRFIGIEINATYCELALKRINHDKK